MYIYTINMQHTVVVCNGELLRLLRLIRWKYDSCAT